VDVFVNQVDECLPLNDIHSSTTPEIEATRVFICCFDFTFHLPTWHDFRLLYCIDFTSHDVKLTSVEKDYSLFKQQL
jgi:hypothetical protein